MTWFYKAGDQEFGPVSKTQLQELIKSRKISGKTLIRSSPTDPWRPLAEMVRPGAQSATGKPPAMQGKADSPPSKPPPAVPPAPATAFAACSQCGRSFPQEQVVTFDNQVICAACKPMFVQRLKEGVTTPGAFRYGGFWIRFGAKLIDGFILTAVQYAIMIPLGVLAFSSMPSTMDNPEDFMSSEFITVIAVQYLIALLIPAIYNTFFIGRFGATLGKMACGIKVVTPEGGKVSYMRALGRNFAEWITWMTMTIGYIIAGFDAEKRALHDRIASTRVVYKK